VVRESSFCSPEINLTRISPCSPQNLLASLIVLVNFDRIPERFSAAFQSPHVFLGEAEQVLPTLTKIRLCLYESII
jgi:hypothetical protein